MNIKFFSICLIFLQYILANKKAGGAVCPTGFMII